MGKGWRAGMARERVKEQVAALANALFAADAVVVGAGAGLSAAAGYAYAGGRFEKYFGDFARTCGFADMYSGAFYPFATLGAFWAYWSRFIWINRYAPVPGSVYGDLRRLLADKDAFVITTNVDHCFQRSGFSRDRLFYTQGDYGLLQCSGPCCQKIWDNEGAIRAMVEVQGFCIAEDGELLVPSGAAPAMSVPDHLVPRCPHCGRPATTNLRIDGTFVQDEGWHAAARRYREFVRSRSDGRRILYLELGVGSNTPVIIKYPFWELCAQNERSVYACVNKGEAWAPKEIRDRSILVDVDIARVLEDLGDLGEARTA